MTTNWLEQRHPEYIARAVAWQYVSDVVAGDPVLLSDAKREAYLPRGRMGETLTLYNLRVQVAHTPSWVADLGEVIACTITGETPSVQLDALGLGKAGDHLWNWLEARDRKRRGATEWEQFAVDKAFNFGRIAGFVDTNATGKVETKSRKDEVASGVRAFASIIHPLNLVNWTHTEDGRLREVLIREERDNRESLKVEAEAAAEFYLYVTAFGWERWKRTEGGKAVQVGSGTYDTPYLDRDGRRVPPVVIVDREGGERDHVYDVAKMSVQHMRIASLIDEDYQRHALKLLQTDGGEEAAKYITRELNNGAAVVGTNQHPDFDSKGLTPVEFSAASTEAGLSRLQSIEGQAAARMGQAWPEIADRVSAASGVSVDKQFSQSSGPRLADYTSMLEQFENEMLHLYAQAVGITDPWDALWIKREKKYDLRSAAQKAQEKKNLLNGVALPTEVQAELTVELIRAAGLAVELEDDQLTNLVSIAEEERKEAERLLGGFSREGNE